MNSLSINTLGYNLKYIAQQDPNLGKLLIGAVVGITVFLTVVSCIAINCIKLIGTIYQKIRNQPENQTESPLVSWSFALKTGACCFIAVSCLVLAYLSYEKLDVQFARAQEAQILFFEEMYRVRA